MAASKVLSTGIPFTAPPENYIRPESDRSNLSDVIKCVDIPVIDLNYTDKDETIRLIRDACHNFGFFQVINHGTSTESFERMLKVAHQFIHLPLAEKLEFYSGDPTNTIRLHCHSLDKFVQDWPSVPPSFKVIHVPSNHIRSIFNRPDLHDVAQSSSGSSNPLINFQGGRLNGSLDDRSDIIKKIGNNIACECDGFIHEWIYGATTVHGDDYDVHERAAASFSSSPNQLLVTVDKNEPLDQLIINNNSNNKTSVMKSGIISSMFKENDIGKTAMGYVFPALLALLINKAAFPRFALQVVLIVFSVGIALIWNGIMLRNLFQRFGRVAEQIGVVMVFLGFFGLLASVLPLALLWAPLLCGVLILLPFILRFLPAFHCGKSRKRIGATSRRPPLLPINN